MGGTHGDVEQQLLVGVAQQVRRALVLSPESKDLLEVVLCVLVEAVQLLEVQRF